GRTLVALFPAAVDGAVTATGTAGAILIAAVVAAVVVAGALVTLFGAVDGGVAAVTGPPAAVHARLDRAGVAGRAVQAVVALFGAVDHGVAAAGRQLAQVGAATVGAGVAGRAVVAFLAGRAHVIATDGRARAAGAAELGERELVAGTGRV